MIKSHTLLFSDFESSWYKKIAKELKQEKKHLGLDNHALKANKFWQNAIIAQTLFERLDFKNGPKGVGFGVGQERLPALFAKHGAHVMATDQDFSTDKAQHWDEYELAKGVGSLNNMGICPPTMFKERLEYMSADMTKIPKVLNGQYDFVWSNCALGHLGSIDAGLDFIENSLNCLKPGGYAVHTTEFNILSDTQTSTGGDTVIFRPRDLRKLYRKLSNSGYICAPLSYTLGKNTEDLRVSMRPQFGNDFSKIQVNGHLATQGLIIIHKPRNFKKANIPAFVREYAKHQRAYIQNINSISTYKKTSIIKEILKSQRSDINQINLAPAKAKISVAIDSGGTAEVYVAYKNSSDVPLFGLYSRLGDSKPIVLATSGPNDRPSVFSDASWPGNNKNRVSYDLRSKKGGKYEHVDYVKPGHDFGFLVTLNAKGLKPGNYSEELTVVQELVGWIEQSKITLSIKVS